MPLRRRSRRRVPSPWRRRRRLAYTLAGAGLAALRKARLDAADRRFPHPPPA